MANNADSRVNEVGGGNPCISDVSLVRLNLYLDSLTQINRCCNEASPSGRSRA